MLICRIAKRRSLLGSWYIPLMMNQIDRKKTRSSRWSKTKVSITTTISVYLLELKSHHHYHYHQHRHPFYFFFYFILYKKRQQQNYCLFLNRKNSMSRSCSINWGIFSNNSNLWIPTAIFPIITLFHMDLQVITTQHIK